MQKPQGEGCDSRRLPDKPGFARTRYSDTNVDDEDEVAGCRPA